MVTNTILIVAAHSDDEALGCAGTICRHIFEGDEVYIHFMTNGVGAREVLPNTVDLRIRSSENAANVMGIKKIFRYDFPDNAMDTVPLLDVIKSVEHTINEVKPNIIYTHFSGDLNIDHQLTNRAVITACRPIKGASVKEIYSFEVLSSTEWSCGINSLSFKPNYIVDISLFMDQKIKALEMYSAEMKMSPHSRSFEAIKSLACFRGNTHGFKYAEAFVVERILR